MTDGEIAKMIHKFTDFKIDVYYSRWFKNTINSLNQDNITDPIRTWSTRLELTHIQ